MQDVSLQNIQLWMQTVLLSRGDLKEKLQTAKSASGLDISDTVRFNRELSNYKRVDIYASGYVLRLVECLKMEYALLADFMGEPLFEMFAKAHIVTIPSSSWTLTHLGKKFPEYLEKTKPTGKIPADKLAFIEIPYDIACYERAKAMAMSAVGLEELNIAPNELSLLAMFGCDFNTTTFKTPECLQLLSLQYPVHQLKSGQHMSEYSKITKTATYLAVSRNQYRLQIIALSQWQYELLSACEGEISFANAAKIAANKCAETTQSILAKLLTWLPEAKGKGCLY
jgi:hypothetical protein